MPTVGGLGTLKAVDQVLLDVLAKVEEEVKLEISKAEGRNGQAPGQIEPIAYKTQLVAGTNFFVKVRFHKSKMHGTQLTIHNYKLQQWMLVDVERFRFPNSGCRCSSLLCSGARVKQEVKSFFFVIGRKNLKTFRADLLFHSNPNSKLFIVQILRHLRQRSPMIYAILSLSFRSKSTKATSFMSVSIVHFKGMCHFTV